MGKYLEFFRNAANDYIDEIALNYGVCKALDILLEIKLDDEKIIHTLCKHFDVKYSDASRVLDEAKVYRKSQN